MGRPRAEDQRDTRADIKAVALDLFSQHGFDATSVRMIARAAGVRESALYHHFKDKQALLVDMVEEIATRRSDAMKQILAETDGRDLTHVLMRLVKQLTVVMQSEKPRKFVQMMMRSGASLAASPIRERIEKDGALQLSGFFRSLQERKLVRATLEPGGVALSFFSALFMSFHSPFSPERGAFAGAAMQRFLQQHVDIIVQGIAVAPKRLKG